MVGIADAGEIAVLDKFCFTIPDDAHKGQIKSQIIVNKPNQHFLVLNSSAFDAANGDCAKLKSTAKVRRHSSHVQSTSCVGTKVAIIFARFGNPKSSSLQDQSPFYIPCRLCCVYKAYIYTLSSRKLAFCCRHSAVIFVAISIASHIQVLRGDRCSSPLCTCESLWHLVIRFKNPFNIAFYFAGSSVSLRIALKHHGREVVEPLMETNREVISYDLTLAVEKKLTGETLLAVMVNCGNGDVSGQ